VDIEKFAERAAAAVRRLMQRELAAVERKWSETLGELRKAFDERLAEVVAKVPTTGEPGIDGKDALEIVIQPELDTAKSYPRGTFVTHLGGLLRASRKTTPLDGAASLEAAGWACIVRGVASAEVEYPTPRTIRTVFRYTDGSETATEVRYGGVLDQGVFRESEAYEKGDGVTFGGSFWIAQKDAPEGKPGTSADWRLAVKKGRDGKDWSKPA